MLSMKNINKLFRTDLVETHALRDFNLQVNEGEFVAVTGPSGSGKTTFLNIAGLLENASGGEYWLDGENVANLSDSGAAKVRNHKIGFIFQGFNLIPDLNLAENVELPLQYQNISKSERKQRVEAILKRVAIDHRADHLPQQLSGGQQQRVAVARALVINPKLVLADEPTGNLDSKNGEEVMAMLRELNREGTTVIMVTHSEKEGAYADRLVRLLDGQIMLDKANSVSQGLESEVA